MDLKSRRRSDGQILGVISPATAEQILTTLANVSGELPLIQSPETYKRTEDDVARIQSKYPEAFADLTTIALIVCRNLMRKAWTAADTRSAEWYLFRLRHLYWETVRRVRAVQYAAKFSARPDHEIPTIPGTLDDAARAVAESDPPPVTEFEAAVFYLGKNLRRALYCQNEECPAHYFFASKKGQKFCSPVCALPTQRAAKLKWWHSQPKSKKKRRKR